MSLSRRIEASQARVVALRDKLFDLLGSIDDSSVSEAQLERADDLCAAIAQEQATLDALLDQERAIVLAEVSP
jgi:hypothetical protein